MRIRFNFIISVFITVIFFTSCEKKIGVIQKTDILTLPSITTKDFVSVYTDSGKVQLKMTAPIMENYGKAETPYTEFRSGINVVFQDKKTGPAASVTARYAKLTDSKNLWELKDSVVAINENGEKLETELLYWDQKKNQIYTDRFVKITTQDQIIQGYGLESDSRLSNRRIKNMSATIYLKDEQ